MKDAWIHAGIAAILTLLFWFLPIEIYLVTLWYMWELSQRVAKDSLKRGVLHWWDIRKWSTTAQREFYFPAASSLLVCLALRIFI